ncbi:hypothetical protein [Pseudarthrobacter sp. ATCC 49987]|uniref:hypothetical protein n=1 Tax=Pseudarthrobacter sp. ATCC 49987 TaxID=2698204 RepID=UPI0019231891|nr:hypothetical protein [Pseudarthrobacter sp. ATCC 49987]
MSGPGGTKTVRCLLALIIAMPLAGGLAACAYEDGDDPQPTAAGASLRPGPTLPAKDPDILAVEARNYAELDQRLARVPGSVLLADTGPADGPGVGFSKGATVTTAGPHTVTAACVGIPQAQISLSQYTVGGGEDKVFEVDCSGTQTQVFQLQKGYIGAQLVGRRDPAGAWTGAVAGIRITVGENAAPPTLPARWGTRSKLHDGLRQLVDIRRYEV